MKNSLRVFVSGLSVILTACVANPRSSDLGPNSEARPLSSTIKFAKGSARLSTQAQQDLDNLLDRARQSEGRLDGIKQITTAAWADRTATRTATLPKSERNLAQDRLRAVHGYLQSKLSDVRYRAINMADGGQQFSSPAQAEARETLALDVPSVSTAVVVLSRQ